MEASLAIVAYRCEVGGKPSESLDIQVRYFVGKTDAEIKEFLEVEPMQSYSNDRGELVTWPLVGVLAIGEIGPSSNGKEVVGFIEGCRQFVKWARHDS